MSETFEAAWAAGFFDGEGHTGSTTDGLYVTITQKYRGLLYRFNAVMGCVGNVYWNSNKWVLQFPGLSNVQYVLSRLWPYLGEIKRSQAREATLRWIELPRTRRINATQIGAKRVKRV